MFNRKKTRCYFAYIMGLYAIVLFACPLVQGHTDPAVDIRGFVRDAGFIFKGQVINIAYRNSEAIPLLDETGAPVFDESGAPLYEDGSNISHTFVTYQIDETYKGMGPSGPVGGPADSNVTLRFLGGQSQNDSNDYLLVSTIPLFDVNDRDFLFVNGNTERNCPLSEWFDSRFRILTDPEDSNVPPIEKIYNEFGLEVLYIPDRNGELNHLELGPFHSLIETSTHDMGDYILEKVTVNEDNEFSLPGANDVPEVSVLGGAQLTESQFGTYLTQLVLDECGAAAPEDCGSEVVSADVNLVFTAIPIPVGEPNTISLEEVEYDRPWLDVLDPNLKADIVEDERIEHELLKLTRGNPVLPTTACELYILKYGAMVGDVSGPQGKPDCEINFFDIGAVANNWLNVGEVGFPLFPLCTEE